jgi:PAS domain S-box-containing protein
MMVTELRKTGIDIMGDMPWGTHFCHFHETKQDLLDTSVPYFKAGLENNEFCLWVISRLLTEEDARSALRHAVPDLDRYLAEQSIEVLPHDEWYLKGGVFDFHRVTNGWHEKLAQALARGYTGMRVIGCTAWLEKKDWKDFREYEIELNESIANHRMIILCAYPLAASSAAEVLDVARIHQFTVARRKGEWEVVETPELKQAKAEIKRLNEELEQRVMQRTRELVVINEELKQEITERKRADEALRESEERFRRYFELGLIGMLISSPSKNCIEVNAKLCEILGYERSELLQMTWAELTHPDDLAADVAHFNRILAGEYDGYSMDKRFIRKDGQVVHTTIAVKCVRRAGGSVDYCLALLQDITERKQAEEAQRATSEQLRALSASLRSAREEEGARIARELHDELGSALTGLKWELESIGKLCSEADNQLASSTLQEKITGMKELIDATITTVRRLSSELRPSILDDLGLVAALEWQAQQFTTRTGITCQFDSFVDDTEVSREQATALFRIFQEALTNILRHAQATSVAILIEEEAKELILEIKDNGRGITKDESSGSQSLGLVGMRERAQLVGGRLTLTGGAGKGTVLTVRVPFAG